MKDIEEIGRNYEGRHKTHGKQPQQAKIKTLCALRALAVQNTVLGLDKSNLSRMKT